MAYLSSTACGDGATTPRPRAVQCVPVRDAPGGSAHGARAPALVSRPGAVARGRSGGARVRGAPRMGRGALRARPVRAQCLRPRVAGAFRAVAAAHARPMADPETRAGRVASKNVDFDAVDDTGHALHIYNERTPNRPAWLELADAQWDAGPTTARARRPDGVAMAVRPAPLCGPVAGRQSVGAPPPAPRPAAPARRRRRARWGTAVDTAAAAVVCAVAVALAHRRRLQANSVRSPASTTEPALAIDALLCWTERVCAVCAAAATARLAR